MSASNDKSIVYDSIVRKRQGLDKDHPSLKDPKANILGKKILFSKPTTVYLLKEAIYKVKGIKH